jgi:N utilization substance protein B
MPEVWQAMNRRSRAREVALQLLFQQDANRKPNRTLMERFVRERLNDAQAEPFCLALFDGVQRHRKEIDSKLASTASNWKLHRMASVDRNVLRMAVFEMLLQEEPTPGPVALNEAIELVRRFGSEDSPSFVNGILDKLYKQRLAEEEKAKATPPVPVEVG